MAARITTRLSPLRPPPPMTRDPQPAPAPRRPRSCRRPPLDLPRACGVGPSCHPRPRVKIPFWARCLTALRTAAATGGRALQALGHTLRSWLTARGLYRPRVKLAAAARVEVEEALRRQAKAQRAARRGAEGSGATAQAALADLPAVTVAFVSRQGSTRFAACHLVYSWQPDTPTPSSPVSTASEATAASEISDPLSATLRGLAVEDLYDTWGPPRREVPPELPAHQHVSAVLERLRRFADGDEAWVDAIAACLGAEVYAPVMAQLTLAGRPLYPNATKPGPWNTGTRFSARLERSLDRWVDVHTAARLCCDGFDVDEAGGGPPKLRHFMAPLEVRIELHLRIPQPAPRGPRRQLQVAEARVEGRAAVPGLRWPRSAAQWRGPGG